MTGAAKFGDFERTIGPHMGAAYNLARWLLRESADAEDVLQEAFMRAFRYFDTFHGERARSWLLAIVRNTCWSFIARRGEQGEAFDDERDSAAVIPLQLTPEPEVREAFVLRELEGMSYKEIADVTGAPIGTVMSRLSRARRELQARLGGAARKASVS